MSNKRLEDVGHRMDNTIEILIKEFTGLRTGRASVNLLDGIKIDSYGSLVPLNQVGNINAPEARLLTVQVWDKSAVKSVEKAIRDANLGLNPIVDGQAIRIPLPPLTEERRQELTKIAAKYAEEAKICVRNVRRDAMEMLKKLEKGNEIAQDEHHRLSEEVQKLTDARIKKIEEQLASKQKDILQV